MSLSQGSPVLRFLRQMIQSPGAGEGSDEELLSRFANHQDEAAFEALLRRHGPMVLGVCRRALRRAEDAEDAFQATFLILVRKAGSIRRPERLGNWLYGVARRTAARARTQSAKRWASDRRERDPRPDDPLAEVMWRDLRPILDEEVRRLPEKYRLPFILCCLEGQTNEQAARQLRCPKGTVLSRLAWARERLRTRLTRRGVALSAAGLATALAEQAAPAAVPAALLSTTGKAASAAGATLAAGLVSAPVAALVEGVLKAMMMTKVKLLATVLLLAGLAGVGGGFLAFRGQAGEPQDRKPTHTAQPAPANEDAAKKAAELKAKLNALAQVKRDVASQEFDARRRQFLAGRGTLTFLLDTARRLLDSELALAEAPADRCKQYQAHWERMREIEQIQQERFDAGRVSIEDVLMPRYWRLEAEIRLTEAQAKAK